MNSAASQIGVLLLAAVIGTGCVDCLFSKPKLQNEDGTGEIPSGNAVCIPEPYLIEITGTDYRWRVRYPGVDGTLGTSDDVIRYRDVHLPLNTDVQLVLKSADYVYGISLPEFEKREIAVPKLEFRIAIRPLTSGAYALDGDEFCGDPHPDLRGVLIVESREQFRQWLGQLPSQNPDVLRKPSQSVSNVRRLK